MNKEIWELENSSDPLERLKYLKRIKEWIEITKETIKWADKNDPLISQEKSFLKMLQTKAANFDVYHQKGAYKCSGCQEYMQDCVCDMIDKIHE